MLTFTLPATLTLYGDGSNSTMLVDLPIGTRIEVEQEGIGWTADFEHDDTTFEIVLSPSGIYNFRLSYPDYETLLFTITVIDPPVEEIE